VTKDQLAVLEKTALPALLHGQQKPAPWVGQDDFPPLYQYHQEDLINRREEIVH